MVLLGRVYDEITFQLADPHCADVVAHRYVGDGQRSRRAVHREDVVRMFSVDRQRHRDQLGLVVPALREEWSQGAVDHPCREGGLLAGPRLPPEERARDLSGGVEALFDIDRQGQEIEVLEGPFRCGTEYGGLTGPNDYGSACLLCQLAGLEGDFPVTDAHGDVRHIKHAHVSFSIPTARMAASCLLNFRSLSRNRLHGPGFDDGRHSPGAGDCDQIASRITEVGGMSAGLSDSCTHSTIPSPSIRTRQRFERPAPSR